MTAPSPTIADTLAAHTTQVYHYLDSPSIIRCGCGERFDTDTAHRAHVAQALSDAGVLGPEQVREREAAALIRVADKWQWGAWADAPRCDDRVQERIANAQYVTDWLRAQVEAS